MDKHLRRRRDVSAPRRSTTRRWRAREGDHVLFAVGVPLIVIIIIRRWRRGGGSGCNNLLVVCKRTACANGRVTAATGVAVVYEDFGCVVDNGFGAGENLARAAAAGAAARRGKICSLVAVLAGALASVLGAHVAELIAGVA